MNSLGMIPQRLLRMLNVKSCNLEACAAHVDVSHYEVPLAGEVSVPAHAPLAAHRLGAGAAVTV